MNPGNRIRKLRMHKSRTLQEIADTCGYIRSLLSKIKNNRVMPAIATLAPIAEALGVKRGQPLSLFSR